MLSKHSARILVAACMVHVIAYDFRDGSDCNQSAPSHTVSPTQAPSDTGASAKGLSDTPTQAPTDTPTQAPTQAPTDTPTEAPTETPTHTPTQATAVHTQPITGSTSSLSMPVFISIVASVVTVSVLVLVCYMARGGSGVLAHTGTSYTSVET